MRGGHDVKKLRRNIKPNSKKEIVNIKYAIKNIRKLDSLYQFGICSLPDNDKMVDDKSPLLNFYKKGGFLNDFYSDS
jgi:hypothetical protein